MTVIEFQFERAGTVAEVVSVDEDGAVLRSVSEPSDAAVQTVGTWRATLDGDARDAARRLVAEEWNVEGTQARPPGSGAWFATKTAARLGLWSSDGLDPVGVQLAFLLGGRRRRG